MTECALSKYTYLGLGSNKWTALYCSNHSVTYSSSMAVKSTKSTWLLRADCTDGAAYGDDEVEYDEPANDPDKDPEEKDADDEEEEDAIWTPSIIISSCCRKSNFANRVFFCLLLLLLVVLALGSPTERRFWTSCKENIDNKTAATPKIP